MVKEGRFWTPPPHLPLHQTLAETIHQLRVIYSIKSAKPQRVQGWRAWQGRHSVAPKTLPSPVGERSLAVVQPVAATPALAASPAGVSLRMARSPAPDLHGGRGALPRRPALLGGPRSIQGGMNTLAPRDVEWRWRQGVECGDPSPLTAHSPLPCGSFAMRSHLISILDYALTTPLISPFGLTPT